MNVVHTAGLSKSYGNQRVLESLDWDVPEGAIVGLLGTNGAGKTTLLKCLLGLLRPTQGEVTVFGEDPWTFLAATKGRIGYVPQEIRIYPWMRGRVLLDYWASFYANWDHAWVESLIRRWDVPQDQVLQRMSTGQRQKLGLLLAVGHRPELLVLDEPVASLDPVARREFLASLLELCSDQTTVIFSTHITSDVERIASHVAILRGGRIRLFDELDQVKERTKRIRILSQSPLPAPLEIAGATYVMTSDRGAVLTLSDTSEERLRELRDRFAADVWVDDMNLEDIFVEMADE